MERSKKTHQKTIKMKKLNCSPLTQHKKNYTCLTNEALYKLRDLWNQRHPDSKIVSNDLKEIWSELQDKMKYTCNKESCWLKQKFVEGKMKNELENSFAPSRPNSWKKNPNEWLTSLDIIQVMQQYEKAYKCFEFMGPSPIDFNTRKLFGDCVWEELCNFDLKEQLRQGKTKIGVIFNTDPHYKDGSHWISLFINVKKKMIYFFDSVGNSAPKEVMEFVDNVKEQGAQMTPRIDFTFDQNHPVEHQYKNTECGIYSLFFIVHMLEDKLTGNYLKTHILKDDYMSKFRKIYFNDDL